MRARRAHRRVSRVLTRAHTTPASGQGAARGATIEPARTNVIPRVGFHGAMLVAALVLSMPARAAALQASPPLFGVESTGYVAIRWVHYSALLVVIGAVAFSGVVLPLAQRRADPLVLPDMRGRAARVGLGAAALLGATAIMRLLAQGYALGDESLVPDMVLLGTLIRVTQWGHAWLLECGAIVVSLVAFVRARRQHRGALTILGVAACTMAFAMALSGHAAAAPKFMALAIISDGLHIIGAGGWLGSLLMLVLVGIPAALSMAECQRWRAVGVLVTAFSPMALMFAGLTAVTGLFAAWLHVPSLPALWDTRYGQVLLLKLAVLSVTAGIGVFNWRRVTPTLSTSPEATRRLQRSAAAELGIGIVVILITAVLVATPTSIDT